ncbi:hypothetical protein L3X38_043641 [Prunus dulcis]|uniref:Uncharacterized protein n=1 Tax=Prunus dulcis TaxID=3755 RepID=A0AAD4UX46_PRUDU|nr:hypothetical protein L3X38_043641 [Prunus dulcis]
MREEERVLVLDQMNDASASDFTDDTELLAARSLSKFERNTRPKNSLRTREKPGGFPDTTGHGYPPNFSKTLPHPSLA